MDDSARHVEKWLRQTAFNEARIQCCGGEKFFVCQHISSLDSIRVFDTLALRLSDWPESDLLTRLRSAPRDDELTTTDSPLLLEGDRFSSSLVS